MTTTEFALRTDGVGKRYRKGWALRDCTLTLPAGGVIALVGPNGAGKTTLLRLVVGLLAPSTGTVEVLGHDVTASTPQTLSRVGFLAQDHPLYKRFTVAEMLRFGRACNLRFDQGLAERRLAKLGIPLDRRTGTLSGGQQAQVALALALAKRPDLLVLDEEYGYVENLLAAFYLVPVVIGAFLGAPLLARELEDGTWQLAWTQAVPRMRWLATKLAALAGVTVTLTGMFTAVLTWFRQPFDAWEGRFQYDAFDLEGLVPVAYALFAFGVATAAGAILRRSLPAFGVAFGAFLAVRMPVALLARPAYATPLTTMEPVPVGGSTDQAGPLPSLADWMIERGYADATGRRLSWTEYYELEDAANRAGTNLNQFLHARGIQQFGVYHPADRFWTFQLIEAALFIAVAVVLIGVVVWRVRRRLI